MGVVAELGRLAICAWAPSGFHLAAGTYAGAVGASFDASSSLELYAIDVVHARIVPAVSLPMSDKFASIAWGPVTRTHPAGLVAAGWNDGAVRIWDAATLLRSPSSDPHPKDLHNNNTNITQRASATAAAASLIPASFPSKHQGPVNALAFNNFVGTLLATAGADGQVLIWDLSTGGTPTVLPPGPPTDKASDRTGKDQIVDLAWNKKVQHILCTGSSSGVVSVWDLKARKQVISLRNPRGRLRASSVVWHPETPTQILIACDEDDGTGAQLWDLRNPTAPLLTFAHHAPRGVQAATWCPHDPDLILTTSRDGRTSILSVSTGQAVCDLPKSSSWNFDVSWSPRSPGLYLASSSDGRVSVNSILTANVAVSVSAETAHALAESFGPDVGEFQSGVSAQSPRVQVQERESVTMAKAPKWIRRPTGVSFGFGGQIVKFTSKGGAHVTVLHAVDRNASIPKAKEAVEAVLARCSGDDTSGVIQFCHRQAADASSVSERMAWDVICLQFEKDSRKKLLRYLGYMVKEGCCADDGSRVVGLVASPALARPVRAVDEEEKQPLPSNSGQVGSSVGVGGNEMNGLGRGVTGLTLDGPAPWDIGGGGDIDGNILDGADAEKSHAGGFETNGNTSGNLNGGKDGHAGEKRDFHDLDSASLDEFVKKSVICGDLETAVDACLYAGRAADALVIAHAGGGELWRRAQSDYLASCTRNAGGNIIGAIAGPKNKLDDFMLSAVNMGKESWKECIGVLATYVEGTEFYEAVSALGHRLLEKNNQAGALVCFICACNTEMIASVWSRGKIMSGNNAAVIESCIDRLLSLVARVRIATAAALVARGDGNFGGMCVLDGGSACVLAEYCALLAGQGDASIAWDYMCAIDENISGSFAHIQDLKSQLSEYLALQQMLNSSHASQPLETIAMPQYGYSNSPYAQTLPGNEYSINSAQTAVHGGKSTTGYQDWGNNSLPPSYAPPHIPSVPVPPMPQQYGAVMRNETYGDRQVQESQHHGGYIQTVYPSNMQAPMTPPRTSAGSYSVTTPAVMPPAEMSYIPASPAPPPPPMVLPGSGPPMSQPAPFPSAPPMTAPGLVPTPVLPSSPFMPGSRYGEVTPSSSAALPPPPPDFTGAPPPTPFHSNATPGAGAQLPPSSEVAVAKQRQKPTVVSGASNGPPPRNTSSSSSLSSMGADSSMPLDKIDPNGVTGERQAIVRSLRAAYDYALGRNSSTMYKKKMEDVSKKLGRLVSLLNSGLLDQSVLTKLTSIAQAFGKGDMDTARSITVALGRELDWESNRHWLQALQRLIDAVVTGR